MSSLNYRTEWKSDQDERVAQMAEIVTVSNASHIAVPVQPFAPLANLISITSFHPLHSIHSLERISTPPPIIHPINQYPVVPIHFRLHGTNPNPPPSS